jgi:inner membrane protein
VPTVFTHAIAVGIVGAGAGRALPPRVVALGALFAALPDLDVIGFKLGIWYGHMLGHRGLSHSLLAAAVLAGMLAAHPAVGGAARRTRLTAWCFLFAAISSHGVLDAMTDGGLGVGFFAPLSNERYFLPWRPIEVSPIGARFFSARGLGVLASELRWVVLPSLAIALAMIAWRRARGPAGDSRAPRLSL